MSRNYGLGQRDMTRAGKAALNYCAKKGEISFSTAATVAERWSQFSAWAREVGIKKMENVTVDAVLEYGQSLAERVEKGELAAATAQNYLSAVNSVMSIATKGRWGAVSPTHECGIPQRSAIRLDAPGGLDRAIYKAATDEAMHQIGDRAQVIIELARELGLRSKEASLLNAHAALAESKARNLICIRDGTKGGRARQIPIVSAVQRAALENAVKVQGKARAVMPADQNWKTWRNGELREIREIVKQQTGGGLHDLRSAYACERYKALTGHDAPSAGGKIVDRKLDEIARLQIAEELGHSRIDVVAEYIGGRP